MVHIYVSQATAEQSRLLTRKLRTFYTFQPGRGSGGNPTLRHILSNPIVPRTPGLVVRNRQSWLLGSGIVMFRGMYFENVLHSSWGSSKAGVASHAELVATLVAQGEYQGVHFHQGHYEAMGHSLCEVLLDLVDTDQSKVEGIVQKLKDR